VSNGVLVVGDSCIDVFVYGRCTRLSPDAPVPVFVPVEQKENGGMALNVYNNLVSLGVRTEVYTNQEKIYKQRYVDQKTNHTFLRVDSNSEPIKESMSLAGIDFSLYDAIVISDYNKGFLTEELIEFVCSSHPLVFIDTKRMLGDWSDKATFIKINEVEYEKTKHTVKNDDNLIVTLGSNGCRFKGILYPVAKVDVKDMAGAGDTFLAGLVSEYLKTKSIEQSIDFANKCSTKVVQLRGVNVI